MASADTALDYDGPEIPGPRDRHPATGQYLCEQCLDAMTDGVLPAAVTRSGLEEACCEACLRRWEG
jgi:hypothetical protein